MSLHVHSEFSSLDGWSSCDEIGDRMVEINCPFCGLTDHGVVAGHIEFDKAMRKRGINPIFGAELYHGIDFSDKKKKDRDQAHLLALAMTDEGLKNLWRLVNATSDRAHFHNVGRVSNEDIIKFKEGIMFTSACPLGLVPQGLLKGDTEYFNWYLNNLGDNFRIEITTYPGDVEWSDTDANGNVVTPRLINELLVEAATERGVPITYGDDGHYARPDQFEEHDMYLAMSTGQSIYTPLDERKMYHPPGAVCIKDEATVRESLHYLPDTVVDEAIQNTWEIGEKADAHLPSVRRAHLPVFVTVNCPWITDEQRDLSDPTSLFVELVEQGIERIYSGSEREGEAWERAIKEMKVLIEGGLEHYFLMAWDVMQFCDNEGIIRGPGRGSSAGCIVAYALGITDVDPLHYELYFERFWNQGRTDGFPDIDSDFSRDRREEIREYLIKRWGENRVCSIGSIIRMKPLATIDKLAKGCGISYAEADELKAIVKKTRMIEIHGHEQIGWNPEIEPGKVIYVKKDVGDEIEKWVGDDKRRGRFIYMCERACSRNSTYGIHASGIVVSDIDLDAYAPAYRRGGKEGIPATMFPMKVIEGALKLIKLDILGLKTLDTLDQWQKQMSEKGVDIDFSGMDKEEFPAEMWDLITEGYTAGIFQIETEGGKKLATQMRPRSIEDLGILVAVNRPGPDEQKFIARKEGREPVTYKHPILEPILEATYGLFVYQEQIIKFMGELGYNLNDADAMRKILGKKQPEKLSDLFQGFKEWDKKGFLAVAEGKGFTEETAKAVWKEIEEFASYSFNKSHAIAYAIIALRCLIAKYYAPSEFYIACIRTLDQQKKSKLMPQYIREARRMGIQVNPPDIRYSKAEVSTHDGHIYFGFGDVTHVSSSGDYICYLRDKGFDISSPESFCADLETFNTTELARKKEAIEKGKPFPTTWKSPKQHLSQKKVTAIFDAGAWDAMGERDISLKEKQKLEEEALGVILTDNSEAILAANQDKIEECDDWDEAVMSWAEKENRYDWTNEEGVEVAPSKRFIEYRLTGTITEIKPTRVKASGASMGIVTIEFGTHELTFAAFSKIWKTHKFLFQPRSTGVFTIRHTAPNEKRGEGYHLQEGFALHE